MADVLAKIIDTKRGEVAALKASPIAGDLASMAADQDATRGFADALRSASDQGYGFDC